MQKLDIFFKRTKRFWFALRILIIALLLYLTFYSFFNFPSLVNFFLCLTFLTGCISLSYITRKEIMKEKPRMPIKILVGIFSIFLGAIFVYFGISIFYITSVAFTYFSLSILLIFYGLYEIRTAE